MVVLGGGWSFVMNEIHLYLGRRGMVPLHEGPSNPAHGRTVPLTVILRHCFGGDHQDILNGSAYNHDDSPAGEIDLVENLDKVHF